MSKLSMSMRGHEWAVMELHPEKGLLWLTSIPCQQGKKVSVFGRVAPIRQTRGRERLIIFFVQFDKEPGSHREFLDDFKRKMEQDWQQTSLRFHYADFPTEGSIDVSKIVTVNVELTRAPMPTETL